MEYEEEFGELISLKVTVSGNVQGVGYRLRCKKLADKFGVTGYAMNLENGNVEICIEGRENLVNIFRSHLRSGRLLGDIEKILESKPTVVKTRIYESFTIK